MLLANWVLSATVVHSDRLGWLAQEALLQGPRGSHHQCVITYEVQGCRDAAVRSSWPTLFLCSGRHGRLSAATEYRHAYLLA